MRRVLGYDVQRADPEVAACDDVQLGEAVGGSRADAQVAHLGTSSVDRSSSDPQLKAPYFPDTAHIPAYNYFDLSASMPLVHGIDFRLGVNNIADKNPPVILNGTFSDCPNTTCNDNTWAGTYDTLGRYIYAHLSAKFQTTHRRCEGRRCGGPRPAALLWPIATGGAPCPCPAAA